MMKRSLCMLLSVLFLLTLPLAGCGDGGEDRPAGAGSTGKVVRMEDYLYDSVPLEGANGSGRLLPWSSVVNFTTLSMDLFGTTDYGDYIEITTKDDSLILDSKSQSLGQYIRITHEDDKDGSYENGDKITFKITVDEDAINDMHGIQKKFKSKNSYKVTVKVSGLADVQEMDVLDAVECIYVGRSGNSVKFKEGYEKQYGDLTLKTRYSDLELYVEDADGNSVLTFYFDIADFDGDTPPDALEITLQTPDDSLAFYGIGVGARTGTFPVK